MTGSISEVSTASTLRRERRRARPDRISASDTGGLLCGEGEEDVVERRVVQRERGHGLAGGADLVKRRAHGAGAPAGGAAEPQLAERHGAFAQRRGDARVGI